MFKVSLLIHLAGIGGTRLLRPYFLPPRLTVGSLPWFTAEGPSTAVARCWFADYISLMVHVTWCSTISSSCSPRVLEQAVSGTLDMTRWNNSMTCSFPWLISLILLSQVISTIYFFFLRCDIPVVSCSQYTIGEKVYRREHNRNIVFIASSYAIDDKLHVSAIWWPSSGLYKFLKRKPVILRFFRFWDLRPT
jgi:hypothetical protein